MNLLEEVCKNEDLQLFFEKSININYNGSSVNMYIEKEDFKQECCIYFSKTPYYDNSYPKALMVKCIHFCLKNIITANNTKGRNNLYNFYKPSLDKELDDENNTLDYYLGKDDNTIENLICLEYIQKLKKENERWYKTIIMKIQGYTYKEIGKILGVSDRMVARYYTQAKMFLEKELKSA